jgi:site-specific DNA recombinase
MRVRADPVEAWVWDQITSVLRDPSIIAGELERRREQGPDHHLEAEQQSTERHLAKLDKQQAKLLRTFRESEDDAIPVDLFKRELAVIEKEKEQLRQSLNNIQRRVFDQREAIEQLDTLTTYCERVAHNLESFGFDEKRLALEALDVTVVANGREWRITGSIPLEEDAGILTQSSIYYAPLRPRPPGRV